jgi:hypothetical protein
VIVLAREDVEVHFHALPTMTEQFQLCKWGIVVFINNIWIMGCTSLANLAMYSLAVIQP